MRKQQVEREMKLLHDQWIEAIKDTPGIGPMRFQEIMKRRTEIARRSVYGKVGSLPKA